MNTHTSLKTIPVEKVLRMFDEHCYGAVKFIAEMPPKTLYFSIKDKADVVIDKKARNDISQTEATFFPSIVQTSNQTIIVVASSFSLYDHISREPYAESVAEYNFQDALKIAMLFPRGSTYRMPSEQSDFYMKDVDLETVLERDMEFRYDNDGEFSYLFLLV